MVFIVDQITRVTQDLSKWSATLRVCLYSEVALALSIHIPVVNNNILCIHPRHAVILELEDLTLAGWTMIFKVVGGASPPGVGQLWASSNTHSENIIDSLDTTTTYNGHYKNRVVINWQTFQPQQVRNFGKRKFQNPK